MTRHYSYKYYDGALAKDIQTDLNEFLSMMTARKYNPVTITGRRLMLREFLSFACARGKIRTQDITLDDIEAYRLALRERGLSPCSMDGYLRAICRFFRYLEEEHKIFTDPTAALPLHRPEPRLKPVPTEKEIKKLLAEPDIRTSTGIRDRAFLELAYGTGARLGELLRLDIFDVDPKAATIRLFGKGSKERVVPLGKQAAYWAGKYLQEVWPVFCRKKPDQKAFFLGGHQGKRLHPMIIERNITGYAQRAGIRTPITPHALRRACVTHMLEHGAHPVMLQMLLGHSGLKTLSHYLKVTITELRKAHKRSKPGR